MQPLEPEAELCHSETATVKTEVYGSSTHFSGQRPEPEKIHAILQMPEPEGVTALKRFLGMVTYLAKFMPYLLEMTEPLRSLEDKSVEFKWLPQRSVAMNISRSSRRRHLFTELEVQDVHKQMEKWKML